MHRLLGFLLALTPKGAAALLEGGRTFGSLEEYRAWPGKPAPRRVRIESAYRRPEAGILRTKKVLLAMMCVGAVAYVGGDGTFASFSAETSNTGSSISSGTLTMSNQVNTATACLSANALTQDNINQSCDSVLALTNVAPGVYGGTAKVTITNSGSIDASKLYFYASSTNAKLSSGVAANSTPGTLSVTALQGQIANGDTIDVSYGGNTSTFTATGPVAAGATSIPVSGTSGNFTLPANSSVTDTKTPVTSSNMNCFDAKTTVAGVGGATKGTDLNFNSITGNPFCGAVVMYVQETTGGNYFCWYGRGKGNSPQASGGYCTAPVSVTLSSAVTGTVGSLPVTALNGIVKSGDTVTVTSGSNTQTCTASATAKFNATAITVSSCAFGATNYPIGSTVVDTTALTNLNSETINTLTNFDTGNNISGKITLAPVTSDGTSNAAATVQLAAGSSRTFQVGLFLPAPTGQNQNALQGLASTLGMTWHMDQ